MSLFEWVIVVVGGLLLGVTVLGAMCLVTLAGYYIIDFIYQRAKLIKVRLVAVMKNYSSLRSQKARKA